MFAPEIRMDNRGVPYYRKQFRIYVDFALVSSVIGWQTRATFSANENQP